MAPVQARRRVQELEAQLAAAGGPTGKSTKKAGKKNKKEKENRSPSPFSKEKEVSGEG